MILAAFSEHKLLDVVRSAVLLCPIAYLSRTKSKLLKLAAHIFLAEVKCCKLSCSYCYWQIMVDSIYLFVCLVQTVHWLGFYEFNPVG
jgi:hypothetical protein